MAVASAVGSTTLSAFVLAVIIPRIFGILKSFSSTKPFLPAIIKGKLDVAVSLPPSISLIVVASVPEISIPIQAFTKLKPNNPANIPGTIPPL